MYENNILGQECGTTHLIRKYPNTSNIIITMLGIYRLQKQHFYLKSNNKSTSTGSISNNNAFLLMAWRRVLIF